MLVSTCRIRTAPPLTCGKSKDGQERSPQAVEGREGRAMALARLLIVEDDWFIGMDIEATVLAAGYEVVAVVGSADTAVACAVKHAPDLVLMDIRLPGARDGIDAALEIRSRADIPCLFVSAHQGPDVRARAEPARPVGWLSKPFSDGQLLEAIDRGLALAGAH